MAPLKNFELLIGIAIGGAAAITGFLLGKHENEKKRAEREKAYARAVHGQWHGEEEAEGSEAAAH